MKLDQQWSRRRFLVTTGAAAAHAATSKGLAQAPATSQTTKPTEPPLPARSRPPEVISGGTQPLMKGMTARPLRYTPENIDFVIRNGREFFNRPVYGPNNAFRVDASDLPEFSLYLPGHGGNLKLGFIAPNNGGSKWAAHADEVIARYRPGRMIYEIRDALLGKGTIRAELLTAAEGSGLMLKIDGQDLPAETRLAWAFGGVSGHKGRRGGDIGCEVEPVSEFFQVRPEECKGNDYTIDGASAHLASKAAEMQLRFPSASRLWIADFAAWSNPPTASPASSSATELPFLAGTLELQSAPQFLSITRIEADSKPATSDEASAFIARSAQMDALASTVRANTPDPYINAASAALGVASDALWDAKQQCVMHGAVAWRQALAGWRGPYYLDALGNHDRARTQFRHWIARQNTSPVTTGDPATGPWDPNVNLTRKENLLHSNGDLSHNHYDMNLVFFDTLLRHLRWTGDMDFAREAWPAIERQLAWEHRLFRRTYKDAAGKELPLYEAYAAIWASDNLQYNGGGAAHSSAYSIFALRTAAKIAKAIGEDSTAHEAEAALIHEGMQQLLWDKNKGLMAESKDLFGPQTAYTNPALWTVYHTIDSEVPDAKQAWQMAAERLAALPHVPIDGEGVPTGCYMLSCSDWLPYMWSLNLLLLAENAHFALALWQTGMREEAFRIFKGNLLDSMFMGLCPGDFHMTSALDVHRQEAQRDFGDPIGISSRALIEGLFGIQPNLIEGVIRLRPGFPAEWNQASLKHVDLDLEWRRDGLHETFAITSRFAKQVPFVLEIPAATTSMPTVRDQGKPVHCAFVPEAVGSPMLRVQLAAARSYSLTIEWHGHAPSTAPAERTYRIGQPIELPTGITAGQLDDPQQSLKSGHAASPGFHIVFAQMHEGDCSWSMPIPFRVEPAESFALVPQLPPNIAGEQLDLTAILKHQITDIFAHDYINPRSEFCSLAIPDNLLGGWANPDGRATIDDAGLRSANGLLKTPLGVAFATPSDTAPNCLFMSYWQQHQPTQKIALHGRARGMYLLMAGSTTPQCSRMTHAVVTVAYIDGATTTLELRNPETWWPIEQDYLLDDYLFVDNAPLPPRVNLRDGHTRILDPITFKGTGRTVPGGAANILHLPLDPEKELAAMHVEVKLYGIVVALMAATLARS